MDLESVLLMACCLNAGRKGSFRRNLWRNETGQEDLAIIFLLVKVIEYFHKWCLVTFQDLFVAYGEV